MTTPTKGRKRVVKGWAILKSNGAFDVALPSKKDAEDLQCNSWDDKLVPCTISYSTPTKRKKV